MMKKNTDLMSTQQSDHSSKLPSSTIPVEEVGEWTPQQVVLATAFVVGVLLVLRLLYELRAVVFLFFVAIVLGTAIRPGVEWLRRRGIPRTTGVIIIYILIAALLTSFVAMVFPLIADQATQFFQNLPGYYGAVRETLMNSHNRLLVNIALRIPSQLSLFMSQSPTPEEMIDQVSRTILYANLTLKGILGALAVFILAYYWTQESQNVIQTLLRLAPPARREALKSFLQLAEVKLGGYIRGQGLLSLSIGLAAFLAYLLIGLPFALVLAMIAGVMELVPIFGPALGAIPAVLVALSMDPGKAVWVLVATALIQMAENAWLVPRIMNNSIGINPIIILLSLVAFSSIFGFAGALLAIPLAAMIHLFVNRVVLSANQSNENMSDRETNIDALVEESQELIQIVQGVPRTTGEAFSRLSEADRLEMASIAQDLGRILKQLKDNGKSV